MFKPFSHTLGSAYSLVDRKTKQRGKTKENGYPYERQYPRRWAAIVGACSEESGDCEVITINEGAVCVAGDSACTLDSICVAGECLDVPLCDPVCERCDDGGCVSLCGNPVDNEVDEITVNDAMLSLQASVGIAECAPCICDVNDNGAVTATDTLAMMQLVVRLPVELTCPGAAAAYDVETTTTTTTTTTLQ